VETARVTTKYVPYYLRWVIQFPQSNTAPFEKRQEALQEFTSRMAREDLEGQAEPAAQPGVPLSRFRNVWSKIPGRINSVVVPRASTTAGPIRLPRYL